MERNTHGRDNWPESLPWIDEANLNKAKEKSLESNKEWMEAFHEQRYKRLVESLDEYFCESPADYQAFMRDLQRALNEIEEWPKQQIEAIKEVRDCLRLHRLISSAGAKET